MPVKVLQPVKTKLVSSPAVFGDADNPVLRQGFILVLVVTTQDDRGLRNVWESATRCMGALGLGHRRFLYSYRSCTKDTEKLPNTTCYLRAFISCLIVRGKDRGL